MTIRTAPYGVQFVAPPGWEDVTYYRFRQFAEKRDFVIEEQEWDQSDPEGWLVKARGRLQQFGVSPIVSVPHPEFAVRGFCRLGDDSRTEPNLWLLTLSFDGQFRTLAVTGPTSEGGHWSNFGLLSTPADHGCCGRFRCASGAQNRKVVPLRFSPKRPQQPSLTGG